MCLKLILNSLQHPGMQLEEVARAGGCSFSPSPSQLTFDVSELSGMKVKRVKNDKEAGQNS